MTKGISTTLGAIFLLLLLGLCASSTETSSRHLAPAPTKKADSQNDDPDHKDQPREGEGWQDEDDNEDPSDEDEQSDQDDNQYYREKHIEAIKMVRQVLQKYSSKHYPPVKNTTGRSPLPKVKQALVAEIGTDETSHSQQEPKEGSRKDQHSKDGQATAEPEQEHEGHHYLHPSESQFWIYILIATGLTCVGGFCSGMTVGLMSIESLQLEVMSMGGNEQEKRMAKRILDVVTNHHLFLVTLLLANAMALESLPLVVHSLMPDWAAILFSTFIVLVIGQIVPQAYCTGPRKIQIAYYAAPVIKTMIKVLWILAYPISKFLDYLLGQHGHQRIQHKDFANFLKGEKSLKRSEIILLTSILELRCERVTDIMIPIKKLYLLSISQKLTPQKVNQIYQKDYSYILVYREQIENVVGVIKVKQFALRYLKSGNKPVIVKQIYKEQENFLSVYADTNLLEMLMLFQTKSYRLALVSNKCKKIVPGIQSIMYTKTDMIVKTKEAEILGIIFLYDIFKEIAEFNEQFQQSRTVNIGESKSTQMRELNKPLLKQN